MTKIYTVESGEYSDYRVLGVYSTREKALIIHKALKDAGTYALSDVVERELDLAVDAILGDLVAFDVTMLRDGTVEKCLLLAPEHYSLERNLLSLESDTVRDRSEYGKPHALECTVFARDEKHAIKIVNERRAKLIAMGEWE